MIPLVGTKKTIRTLLNHLLGKAAVVACKDGRRYLHNPAFRRDDWRKQESRSLFDRVFSGKVAPLLAHFGEHENLLSKEVDELRKLIDAIERKGR